MLDLTETEIAGMQTSVDLSYRADGRFFWRGNIGGYLNPAFQKRRYRVKRSTLWPIRY